MATALQFAEEITVEGPRESLAERNVARFYFAIFWSIVFTGAVRKWIFPGASIFYLLQDIPIGLSYLYALRTGLYERGYLFLSIMVVSMVLIFQGLMQIIVSGLNTFVAVVGIHNYLFYLPMLLIFPLCMTEKYRRNFIWWNLMLSIPMCILAVAQAESPTTAWVNRTSEGDAFGLPGVDIARVMGTFNFTVFYGIWVSIAVALCMGEWLLPQERRVIQKKWLLILCTFTANVCHLISGSRSAIALAGAAILGALVAAFVLGSSRAIAAIGGIFFLLPVGAAATYIISPTEYNIVVDRFTGESGQADIHRRLIDGVIGWATVPDFNIMGAGIGMGVDASHVGNTDTYNFTYNLSETDTIRTVMELGTPVGLFYMLMRIALLGGMIFISFKITRAGSSPHVIPLSFCMFAQAYQGDLTRAATMTASQVMVAYVFILSAYYYPDNTPSPDNAAVDSLTRSV